MFTKDCILSQMIPFQFHLPYSVSIRFNIILTSPSSYLVVRFSDRHCVRVPKLSVSTTHRVHLILVILIIFVEEYELEAPHAVGFSSHSRPNTLPCPLKLPSG